MRRGPTHYEVLGIPADAPVTSIRRAYRDKAKTAHPDAGGDSARFRRLLDAYETLTDDEARRAYDDSLGIRHNLAREAGGTNPADGWGGANGTFTGDVEFPAYLRDTTDQPWTPRPQPAATDEPAADPVFGAPAPARVPAADVLWWWPDQAIAPPVAAGPLLVVASRRTLVALATLSGHEAWRVSLPAGVAGRPAIMGDTAVVWTEDGVVHGLDLSRGVSRWQIPLGPPGPGGLVARDDVLIGARTDARLVSVVVRGDQARSGWTARLSAPVSVPLTGPTRAGPAGDPVGEDNVVAITASRTVEAIDVRSGRHRWRITVPQPIVLPACAVGGSIWLAGGGASGTLVRLDAATGAVAATFRAGLAVAGLATDARLLFASVAGPARLVAVDEPGRVHLAVSLDHVCPEPAIDQDRAYLADPDGTLVAVDRVRGVVRATATVPFEPLGAPQVIGDRLVVLARDGRLWAASTEW
jgi:outer membrane protein assembly factor BamB